nr:alpha/beta hydrolase [Kibdelosporangium sp. MJ126-NF4]CEL21748.1 hydrolase [Kibdelosporangium sp. MJ126-NF4]CTQ92528.1 hydrolase [Kibdelosporangium sp. MJ126-NF4]
MVVRLATRQWGDGDRHALLLHGISSSGSTWWQVADALGAQGFTVTAPDLRGHGDSPHASHYTAADYAADVRALGERWDLVVGHSLGGLIALHAARDPDWTTRLVLLDPAVELSDSDVERYTELNTQEVLRPQDPEALLAANPRWHPEDARLKFQAVLATSPYVSERTMRENAPWHYLADVEALAVPTLILGADPAAGGVFGPNLGDAVAAANTGIEYRVVAEAGHSVHRDAPDAVLEAIAAWLG